MDPEIKHAAARLIALLCVCCLTSSALADGKVFSRAIAAPPPIPDQQAIIVYDSAKQIETLAIETRFVPPPSSPASSTSADQPAPFAWVVPLPGPEAPTIRPATTGLFPTVRAVFQPRVRNSGDGLAFPLIILTAIILLFLCVTMLQRSQKLIGVLLCIPISLLLLFLLLPTLGRARSFPLGAESLVNVLDRTTVGSFDITVIGAAAATPGQPPMEAGKHLAAWLKDNGFQMPAGVEPVLDHYAARQWVFAACKLQDHTSGPQGRPLAPHPLIFTFKATQCVYPLELTGVGNGPLTVDLYVFSNRQADAPGFKTVRCAELSAANFVASNSYIGHYLHNGNVQLAHPVLKELATGTTVATKLSATLSPQQQATDAVLSWRPASESGGVKYSRAGAFGRALDLASVVLLIGVVVLIVIAAAAKEDGRWVFRQICWPLVVAAALCGATYAVLPKISVVPGGFHAARVLMSLHEEVAQSVSTALESAHSKAMAAVSLENARAAVRDAWAHADSDGVAEPKEEDSPGNYTVTQDSSGGEIVYVWHDAVGAPQRMTLWQPPEPSRR